MKRIHGNFMAMTIPTIEFSQNVGCINYNCTFDTKSSMDVTRANPPDKQPYKKISSIVY